MVIRKYGRYWAVYDGATLVCVCLYKASRYQSRNFVRQTISPCVTSTCSVLKTRDTGDTQQRALRDFHTQGDVSHHAVSRNHVLSTCERQR